MDVNDFNKKLKEVNSFKEFKELIKLAKHYGFYLYTKKTSSYCFDFEYDKGRLYYLIDNGSRGSCKLDRIYIYLKFM